MNDQRQYLQGIARRAMREKNLDPDFPPQALDELRHLGAPPVDPSRRDLRDKLWCSIDNDDSRDLDQLTVAETAPDGSYRLYVAVADVDALVRKGTAIDGHARKNTTSVYTAAAIYPMLPEKLSTDLTSLGPDVDREATVVEMAFATDGSLQEEKIYLGLVRNRAKLAYNATAAWLDGQGPRPAPVGAAPGMEEAIRLQDRLAHILRDHRYRQGFLPFESIEAKPVFDGGVIKSLHEEKRNRAKDLIEDFMIAANSAAARFLAAKNVPSIRRVVREPRRWERIVEIAKDYGFDLPEHPDPKALQKFLEARQKADPEAYPDLSLVIIKLMGSGEYVLLIPNRPAPGHFGLALRDYTHSTAPNRRFPDLITQRLVKSVLGGRPPAYNTEELSSLARHCTEMEDAVKKVERTVAKSAAALLLHPHIGEIFDAVITAVANNGTWLRIFSPPTEGKLIAGREGRDTGTRLKVRLVAADPEKGHIDFEAAG